MISLIKKLKLKHKLIVVILSITSCIIIIGSSLLTYFNYSRLKDNMIRTTRVLALVTGNSLIPELSFDRPDDAHDVLDKIRSISQIKNVFVFDETDKLFVSYTYSNDYDMKTPELKKKFNAWFSGDYLHLFQPIIHRNVIYGVIYLRVSTKQLDEEISQNIMLVSGVIVILIIISFVLAILLQNVISEPILKLADVANRISSLGNYGIRVEYSSSDEIGQLYQGFNSMIRQIQKRERQLDAARTFLTDIIESMPSVLIAINGDEEITHWNRAATNMLGIVSLNAIGQKLWDVSPEFEKYRSSIISALKKKETLTFHKKVFGKGLEKHFVNLSFYPITTNGLNSMVIMAVDVTEIETKEQQLRQAQKMETVGTLAGGLAHDFNNVLGGIIGTLSLINVKMKREQLSMGGVRSYLGDISNLANRATDMVQQLLALSRKEELTFSTIDLARTIESVIKICKTTFDKSIDVISEFDSEEVIIHADQTQIEQVFLNLCVNAAHSMTIMRQVGERWGGRLVLSYRKVFADEEFIKSHPDAYSGWYWAVVIKDEGVGIDAASLNKIFDPFYTTKEKGVGTGLGLAMVYNIILQHKGFIKVESEPQRGTTFTIFLPEMISSHDSMKIKPAKQVNVKCEGVVLVIDDEIVLRKLATHILEDMGFTVMVAEDGEKGLEIFSRHMDSIDLVILDMLMPRKSGIEVYENLKAAREDIKVILASGFRKDERVEKVIEMGVDKFIEKPYTYETLSETVMEVLKY